MKSTKRYFFSKAGLMGTALVCAMLFAFCGKENTIYSYAYTQATGIVKAESAKVRSEANTSSESVAGVKQAEQLTIIDETKDSAGNLWYKVKVNGDATGYIRADLVTKDKAAVPETTSSKTENKETPKITETPADVTESTFTTGTVTEASINVRKGPAATDEVVASAKKGTVVNISGQAKGADGKDWLQVSFLNNNKEVTGFIRSDLLDKSTEAPSAKPEEGTAETTETEVVETTEEMQTEPAPEAMPENNTEIANVVSSKIIPEGTDFSKITIDQSLLEQWKSGNFYMLYTKDSKGEASWYLYDIEKKTNQKIANLAPEEDTTQTSALGDSGKIVIIVLAVLLIIMIVLCTVLFLKLRAFKNYDEEDEEDEDDEDDEDEDEDEEEDTQVKRSRWKSRNFLKANREEEEDDDEDEEEDEEEEEEEIPVKRPIKKMPVKKVAVSNKSETIPKRETVKKETVEPKKAPEAKPIPAAKAPQVQRKAGDTIPKFQMDLDDDDDEFEFGFLNMDSKDDL